jgi:hypothetical protein
MNKRTGSRFENWLLGPNFGSLGTSFVNSLRELTSGTRFENSLQEIASGPRSGNALQELTSGSYFENSLRELWQLLWEYSGNSLWEHALGTHFALGTHPGNSLWKLYSGLAPGTRFGNPLRELA